jgi:hypothetical protein
MRFTVKGDTLFGLPDEQAVALTEAVTSVRLEDSGVGAFYVRVR